MKAIDIILGLVIVGLIVVLVVAVSTRVPEPFTELYFENHTSLPSYSSDDDFIFTINNLENQDMTYDVLVRAESDTQNLTINAFSIDIPSGQKKMFRTHYTLPEDFSTGRIIVELLNKEQSIHFWTTYAWRVATYFGKEVDASCVPEIPGGNITLKLNATDGENIIILNNGIPLYNLTLSKPKTLHFNATGSLDIWFTNDYYNETEGVDRNLFLRYLKVGDVYYEKLLVDEGSGINAFDCQRTRDGASLYSNGALRVILTAP
ncbi:MAG: hypothetical protein ABIJ21_09510 [Nanoarchaeota archaeon]